MSAIDVGRRHRDALGQWPHDVGARANQTARKAPLRPIGVLLLAVAGLVFASSIAALAAGDPEDCAASAGNFDQKIAICTRVIGDDTQTATSRADAYNSRGVVYFRKGDLDHAIADYGQAIRIDPRHAAAFKNRGNAFYYKNDYDSAISDCSEAIRLDQTMIEAYKIRGISYYYKNDFDGAIVDFVAASKIDPNFYTPHFPLAYRGRGLAFARKLDFDDAIADYDEAVRLKPTYDDAYRDREIAYNNANNDKNEFDRAIAGLSAALKLTPNYALGYYYRGLTYFRMDDLDHAIADYGDAIKRSSSLSLAYDSRGFAYAKRGDYDLAQSDYDEAIRRSPKLAGSYAHRGALYLAKGEDIHAVADFNNAIKLNPAFVEAYDNRAIAYIELHRVDDAIADFQTAQSIDPSDKTSREKLASIAPVAPADPEMLGKAMGRLSIDLPIGVAAVDPVRKPLGDLGREPCDQQAIVTLARALEQIGRRRDAANAQLSFSAACGGHAASLKSAANILLGLSDFTGAAAAASGLIKLEPHEDGNYLLRALAYDRGGSAKKAIDDYEMAIDLFGNKANLASDSHLAIARNYEKLGQFCDAALAIESYVALNPERNDSGKMQAIITDDMAKGKCEDANSRSEEVFKIPPKKNVVRLPVMVNGVRGTFIMDTGATLVTVKAAFAQKAKLQIDQDSTIKMHTANGITEGKRGHAATVQVRSLQAKDVLVAVQSDGQSSFGEGVDGLLGMSFLSRFKVSIDTESVKISSRNAK